MSIKHISRFYISRHSESMRHQNHFFQLGYKWPDGYTSYRATYARYLYLHHKDKTLAYSHELSLTHNSEVNCKLLHPKQTKFLRGVLGRQLSSKELDISLKISIVPILTNGYYNSECANWLNELLDKRTKLDRIVKKYN